MLVFQYPNVKGMNDQCYVKLVAIQVDYDLSFSEPSDSSAALSVPFRLTGKTSLTVAMWVKFAHRDEPGVFFTLYNVG